MYDLDMRNSMLWWEGLHDWERALVLNRMLENSVSGTAHEPVVLELIRKLDNNEDFTPNDIKTIEMISVEL